MRNQLEPGRGNRLDKILDAPVPFFILQLMRFTEDNFSLLFAPIQLTAARHHQPVQAVALLWRVEKWSSRPCVSDSAYL